jgi:preprotein translocase subunit YajC
MNWEVILWSSVTVGALITIVGLIAMILSAKGMKKQRESMKTLQEGIKVGARVVFAGGFYGRIVKVKNDELDIELTKDVVVTVSRYSVQSIVK